MRTKLFINGFSYLIGDADAADFTPFVETRKLRRMEGISKNALLCAFRAFAQAGVDINAPKTETGLSIAMGAGALESTCKFMDSIITDGDALSSPTAFAGSVHNSAGLTLSMFLHITGPCLITGQLDASFAGALLTAQQLLAKKMCQDVLVAVAEDINPVVADIAPAHEPDFASLLQGYPNPFKRAAAAFLVTDIPTEKTQFALENIAFSRDDAAVQSEDLGFCSCAHSAVSFARELERGVDFNFCSHFAGSTLKAEAKKYVAQK